MILSGTQANQLNLHQLIVYSKLACIDRPARVGEIAAHTHIGETEVKLCLSELIAKNLAAKDADGFYAVEPDDKWFVRKTSGSLMWHRHFESWPLWHTTQMTLEATAIWSYVFAMNRADDRPVCVDIANATRIPADEVLKNVTEMQRQGLLAGSSDTFEVSGLMAIYVESFGQELDKQAMWAVRKIMGARPKTSPRTTSISMPSFTSVPDAMDTIDAIEADMAEARRRKFATPELSNMGDYED